MNGQIIPLGLRRVNSIDYIFVYLPMVGEYVVARKQVSLDGVRFDYCTISGGEFDAAWGNPVTLSYVRVANRSINLAILCNQLVDLSSATPAGAGLTTKTLSNDAGVTPTVVKARSGQVYAVDVTNASAATVTVALYSQNTAPIAGNAPTLMFTLPAGQTQQYAYVQGAGFTTGIALSITSNLPNSGTLTALTLANQVTVNVAYA